MIDPTLAATPQWVVVKLVPLPDGKTDKIPFNYLTREACNAHEHQNWTVYEAAGQIAQAWPAGADGSRWTVGFALTERDDFFCVDVDGAYNATTGVWSELSQQIVAALPGCMVVFTSVINTRTENE